MFRYMRMIGRCCGLLSLLVFAFLIRATTAQQLQDTSEFYDAHVHLTNYIQEGPDIRDFLKIMGTRVGRSVLFGIPLQQEWSYRVSGDEAPTYYLSTDAPLYYYSFTDAFIAQAYKSLPPDLQARFDPMITGFNPADMYAADHIRRVLETFPGIFSGIGEFTIHKEFVSSKIAGGVPSLLDPALDRILSLAEDTGLVVMIHNDVDVPFAKPESPPAYLAPIQALLKRHPGTTIIWAHTGLGRVIHPIENHARMVEAMLKDPDFNHVYFDISWDEVAKYLTANPRSLKVSADLINRYPDRFLFGTDALAPRDAVTYFKTYDDYATLWPLLTREASLKVRKENYRRIFDEARRRVRAWETAHTN
jgi:predicted TIM-barrel fold metal-dependent hydrolase